MKVVKPFTVDLSVTESLLVISGLNYIINDKERHELDRELAKKLRDKILKLAKDNAIEIGGRVDGTKRHYRGYDKRRLYTTV